MKNSIITILKFLGLYKTYKVPKVVSEKFVKLNEDKKDKITDLVFNYCEPQNYASEEDRQMDINAVLFQRLSKFRETHIPFIYDTISLKGKKILEIGCGTGASSIALSEQGPQVTGIDVNAKALRLAEERAKIYNQQIDFIHLNAVEIDSLKDTEWDIIIYFASIEHMTPEERKISLRKAFKILKDGGHLCVFGTPNRLWPLDIHTSHLPFYMWLQDELAFDYSKFSTRKEFNPIHSKDYRSSFTNFYRWGRGVSFHEFQVALGTNDNLNVVGALPIFLRRYSFIQKISYKQSLEYKYKNAISQFGPKDIHPGFYECYLDIIIEK